MTSTRYGVFLRPDPATCWAITQITLALRQQFGLTAAAAFAPHATLIGNLQSSIDEPELVNLLDSVFAKVAPTPVYNQGIRRTVHGTFEYDINLAADGAGPNEELDRIAGAVKQALEPIHEPHEDSHAPNVQDYQFAAHLGLASFELREDNRLSDEVGEFIAGLPISPPASFVARWYTLFRFSADWNGPWWEAMPWHHVRSWDAAKNKGSYLLNFGALVEARRIPANVGRSGSSAAPMRPTLGPA